MYAIRSWVCRGDSGIDFEGEIENHDTPLGTLIQFGISQGMWTEEEIHEEGNAHIEELMIVQGEMSAWSGDEEVIIIGPDRKSVMLANYKYNEGDSDWLDC